MADVEYAIRDVVSAAHKLEAAGRHIDYLNVGDPVQFGFQPPEHVREALSRAVMDGHNYYTSSEGLPELRDEIAIKEGKKGLGVSADDVLVTNGISEALEMVLDSIVEEGDEVLLPGPYYPPYASYIRLNGGRPVEFETGPGPGIDLESVRSKITPRTVAICIINPNNPTGYVLGERALKGLVDLANEHNLYIICDEIYDQITFDDSFAGIGRVAGDSPVILLNGFSKVHLMTGWRLGYIALGPSKLLDPLRGALPKLARVRICANTPVQYAALESLRGPQGYIQEFVEKLRERRDLVVRRLNAMPGISCAKPQGAFYTFPSIDTDRFPSDRDFVMGLLEQKGVLTVHGSGFGKKYGSGHFRIVYLPDPDMLESAMDRIEEYVS
ncbi:aspartate/tyrosine/aromatic aminotransferase [Cenarchaeum symbiosum A]|uniref:Aminotransferase n=1 Tax=Cenarchaeum symbiosum (strain A) TaxID=414004 RepID=A0RZ12_CENSY|nr:aspartate/tyrosine/aromatic aminotransferase [Cenarchaeum symbiosum A]